ncbi:MAG: Verru_Chthon cassette protein C [Verrucomicrobiales bacterium]|jgi:uncharacterized protein (TIGR02599 family)|nr:Verru_Chthon cassette protein C [Verrucomicrobiales bacterium]
MSKSRVTQGKAFTLIELTVAVAILATIMVLVANFTQQASKTWQSSQAKVESFQGARAAFEAMTRRLSQVTLNNYYGYDNDTQPTKYIRKSELHFLCGKNLLPNRQITHAIFFQVPLGYSDDTNYTGMGNLLNACGYFIQYGDDGSRPSFLSNLPPRYRFRLMQFTQPTQELSVYSNTDTTAWFTSPLATSNPPIRQLAENVVALVILPKRSTGDQSASGKAPLSPDYEYNTRDSGNPETYNQLPPLVEVVMVAIDEPSALRLGNTQAAPNLGVANLFQQSAKEYDDISTLETTLQGRSTDNVKLNYRIFRADVPIRTAKWSTYEAQ